MVQDLPFLLIAASFAPGGGGINPAQPVVVWM
jgi:hypothetical protein